MLPFPSRPRLSDHALARRHVTGGEEIVIIHDTDQDGLIRIGPREWGLIACADGTRDLEGILLAAARTGNHARLPALKAFLEALHAAGLLADGTESGPVSPPPPIPADRPLEPLPDFALSCDGSGSCCRIYASVVFLPVDVARARALLPLVRHAGNRPDLAFCPERGSVPDGASAVTLIDGRCAYLDEQRRCLLHTKAGPSAKPLGCRSFPATFTDDGECIRCSVAVECACVLASLDRPGGEPLIPPAARTLSDLEDGIFVAALPVELPITVSFSAPRAEVAVWSRFVTSCPPPAHVPSAFCSLAAALQSDGLVFSAKEHALARPPAPDPPHLEPLLVSLAARTARRSAEDAEWRSQDDLARKAVSWIALAARALLEPGAISRVWNSAPAHAKGEAFYLRASIHGHHLLGDLPLSIALRDRAVRLLVARALPQVIARDPPDPAIAHPLALVEAILRGHGLASYAYDVL